MGRRSKKDKDAEKVYIKEKAQGRKSIDAAKNAFPDVERIPSLRQKAWRLDKRQDISSAIVDIQRETISDLVDRLPPEQANKILVNIVKTGDLNALKEYYKLSGASIDRRQSEQKNLNVEISVNYDQIAKALRDANAK